MNSKVVSLLPASAGSTPLAREPDILAVFEEELRGCGVVGEGTVVKVTFLALVSRILDRPVSICVKGVSGSGKSFPVEQTLRFFPESAYVEITAMSPKALVYDTASFEHRMLVIFEAAGIPSDGEYILRSLLSEHKIRYRVVQTDEKGRRNTVTISKDGPTGLILTTTAVSLHPENETRLFSVPADDSREQTRRILRAQAAPYHSAPDFRRWHEHQEWLEGGPSSISIPFLSVLAELVPDDPPRIRRDFPQVRSLIEAHSLAHRGTREVDGDGRVVATLDDYRAVYDLVSDILAECIEATVFPQVREVVEVTKRLLSEEPGSLGVSQKAIANEIGRHKGTISRSVQQAINQGYLVDEGAGPGHPAKLVLGDPLPSDRQALPTPDELAAAIEAAKWEAESNTGDPV